MKYPSLSLISKYSFRVFLLVLFLAAMFPASWNAQEKASIDIAQAETDHHFFIDRNIADSGGLTVANIAKETSGQDSQRGCFPEFKIETVKTILIEKSDAANRGDLHYKQIAVVKSQEEGFSKRPVLEDDPLRWQSRPLSEEPKRSFERFLYSTDLLNKSDEKKDAKADDDPPAVPPLDRFHWGSAINQSLMVLGIQHGYALVAQEKTRRALANGNFFTDYWRSARSIKGWDDGNRFLTNYLAHPMQGGLTGFIFVQNHDRAKKQKFADSKQYWKDRFTAFVWSTAWSTQFELGPISQSSIGNVGMYGHMGYVDLVMTPTVGTAWLISEEAIDRYVIRHIETQSPIVKALARMFLNPMRTVANLLRFREPWYRDRPFGH
jgi:hypothetical protein